MPILSNQFNFKGTFVFETNISGFASIPKGVKKETSNFKLANGKPLHRLFTSFPLFSKTKNLTSNLCISSSFSLYRHIADFSVISASINGSFCLQQAGPRILSKSEFMPVIISFVVFVLGVYAKYRKS